MADDYAANTTTTGRVNIGGAITGQIETSGDNDWFAVTLTSGHIYQFTLNRTTTGGLSDPYLTLYNSTGSTVTWNDDGGGNFNSLLNYTATASGTFYLGARDYSSGTGFYTLAAAESVTDDYAASTSTPGRVTVGSSTTGRIETSGDNDWFAVTLAAGNTYQFNLTRTASSGLSDPYLTVYNSSGTAIATNDDSGGNLNSQMSFTATASGTYYLGARDYSSGTGSYTVSAVSLTTDDYAANTSTAGRVTVGSSSTGRIETSGDSDWFAVSLTAGRTYEFHLDRAASNGLSDPYLTLYNSSGSAIASNNDSGGNLNSLLTYVASSTGTFYLGARDFSTNTGNYTVSATALSLDDYAANTGTTGRVSVGGSTTGNVETAGDNDWFAVTLSAGTAYQFALTRSATSGLSDPYLTLYNSSGTAIASNDDSGGNLNSLLNYTPTAGGTYYLGARDYSSGTGSYTLSASGTTSDDFAANTSTTGRVTVGGSSTGRIEVAGDNDWFAVSLTAGTTYQMHLDAASSSGLSDPYLNLYNSAGTLLTYNDDGGGNLNSLITFTPTTSGTYYLGARTYGSGTGAYSVSVSGSSAQPPSSGYQITINYSGDPTYQTYFQQAAARWSQIITQDVPDISSSQWGAIDDLLINATVQAIDGVGNILGQATADAYRSGSNIPYHGYMMFDSADLQSMVSNGTLLYVIEHEMGHVLGLAPRSWSMDHLASGFSYTGANGVAEYRILANNNSLTSVPLETTGGSGTAGAHWSEAVFDTELMTGYAERTGPMPISIVTVGALADLGYSVSYAAADVFHL